MKRASLSPGDYVYFKSRVPLHKISVGAKQWRYYDFGPKDVPPLICIPGIAGTADVFYKQIMFLSMKGYRVISIDIPCIWNHHEWIHAFEKFLDAINVHHVHLYGASLGGFLSQLFAQHRPRRVKSLVLSNTFLDTQKFSAAMPWSSVLSTPPPPLPSSQIARIATLAVPSLLGVDLSFSSLATKTSLPACHRAPPSFPAFKSKRPPCRVLQSNEEEVVIDEDDWILMLLRYPKSFMMMNVIQSVNYLISEGVQAKNLSGTLSPSIGNLTNLETILLQSNNISGTIPSEIGKLPKLHTLIFQTTISVEKFPSL